MELERLYFYTATILKWQKLLERNDFKDIIIESLKFLIGRGKIKVYGFVIMPNHIHLIWEMLEINGKETTYSSFMKFTAHLFLEKVRLQHPQVLPYFRVSTNTRVHQFWERDSLPIELYTRKVIEQKLDYIHNNPLQEKWNLAKDPSDYHYSSAAFYEKGIDPFSIVTHYLDRIG